MRIRQRWVGLVASCLISGSAFGQTAPLASENIPFPLDSGPVGNPGNQPEVVFSAVVNVPDALWLRLTFDEVRLSGNHLKGAGSYLRITSSLDGAVQYLNAVHVAQWQRTSAYFNGDEVTVEIVAFPGTGDGNRLVMSEVIAGTFGPGDRSICGPTDDRTLSNDPRAARLMPIGCSGWLFDDCTHCFHTAGHCTSNLQVAQFNVPLSNANGSVNHPPPEDQYAIDPASLQTNGGQGVGNDYAYFGVFPNSNTGLTPVEAQGDWYRTGMPPPVQGQDIRITGYGTVSSPVPPQWNQVQKTHAGPYWSFSGTTLQYRADTTGGNSGSPVIDDSTGLAIGIHTHGGCSSGGGANSGTGYNHAGLQGYVANPKGVCECPALLFHYPDGVPTFLSPAGGEAFRVWALPSDNAEPKPGTGVLHYSDGGPFQSVAMVEEAPNQYVAVFPAFDCGTNVRFYVSAQDTQGKTWSDPKSEASAHAALAAYDLTTIVALDFETNPGWTVTNTDLTDGAWERGVPVGGGLRGDPPTDFDGSGQCWLTDNVSGNSDVDGGPTTLTSHLIDLSGAIDPIVSYARWFYNQAPDIDRLTVEVSNDNGTTWKIVEVVPHTDGWVLKHWRIADFVVPTAAMRFRFSAVDNPNNSVTEAAIDRFRIDDPLCDPPCRADFNGDTAVNSLDVLAFLNAYAANDPKADFNGDTVINSLDVLVFLNAYTEGCP